MHPNQMGLNYMRKMLPSATKTLFTREEKAVRKYVIGRGEYMNIRDNVLGIRPTPPATIVHHPRFFDPPLSCRDGKHQWETGSIMGIPRLKCKKCGRIAFEGSFNGTETKREIRERHIPKPTPLEPNFEVIEG